LKITEGNRHRLAGIIRHFLRPAHELEGVAKLLSSFRRIGDSHRLVEQLTGFLAQAAP
jgi:hypothetical protein